MLTVMLSRMGRPRPRPRPRPTVSRPRPRPAGPRPRPTCPRPRPRPRVTSRAETGRDQEYVLCSRPDRSKSALIHSEDSEPLHENYARNITGSSQRTVDGTPRKEFNQRLGTSDQQNKNNSLDLLRMLYLC
jgi:hypothetical protein